MITQNRRSPRWRRLIFAVCCLCGLPATSFSDTPPQTRLPGIAFVGGPVRERFDDEYSGAYHWREGYVYPRGATYNAWERANSAPRPGRNLYTLIPPTPEGKVRQLTFLKEGNVYDPEPSADGQTILFSMRRDHEEWFHLYEVRIDGSGLRQLTNGPFNDVSGAYLPDGQIVFCSDRTGVLDEYHEERSEFLFRMRGDGTEIEQLTFNPGVYFEPTILSNGLILCSYWDAFHISVPPFLKHETYLVTLKPDGTDERPYFGVGEYRFLNRTRHSAVGLTKPGEMPDGRILVQSEFGPALCDPDLGLHYAQALAPVFPGTTSVQTGGTTHMSHVSPTGTRSTPYPLPDGRFLCAATLPGCRDLGLFIADPVTRSLEKIYDRPNLSEWDPVPIGMARPLPRQLPDTIRDHDSRTARFLVVSGRESDTPERRELNRGARFARILQSEYNTVTVSSHTSLETRILGVVPIQADGSFAFDAPADTPLFIETLDARGNRLVTQASHMSGRAGETKSCFGCHASASQGVDNPHVLALTLPIPRVSHDSTDLSYRRHDPQEYRRHAMVTTAASYRPWLKHDSAELRRAGLESLGYLPDEVQAEDRETFAKLLRDPDIHVRQQAAHTLAMTGTVEQIPALLAGLDDPDPHVGHFSAMALEAITGENLSVLATPRANRTQIWQAWWREVKTTDRLFARWAEGWKSLTDSFAREARMEAVARTRWLSDPQLIQQMQLYRAGWLAEIRKDLSAQPPSVAAVRAAGMLRDVESLPAITPWLIQGTRTPGDDPHPDADGPLAEEVRGIRLAQESALALGRIGTPEAIRILWDKVAETVPSMAPPGSRYYQTGPRPEEYTYLRALILAGASPTAEQIPYLIALLPYSEGEKPRFEDRTRSDSQRVWLVRTLLERSHLRRSIVQLASDVVRGAPPVDKVLYSLVLTGTNLDRPRNEHGRIFPKIQALQPEQGLHLLASLAESLEEIPVPAIAQTLHSKNHRERIEAAVVFRRLGFPPTVEQDLLQEIRTPYSFSEMSSIGRGRPGVEFRDKAYMMIALAAHTTHPDELRPFCDADQFYRDLRLGLALGLGFRGTRDALPLLHTLAGDPIFAVHRLAEYARDDVQHQQRLAGDQRPIAPLPPYTASQSRYAPPAEVRFDSQDPDPLHGEGSLTLDLERGDVLLTALRGAMDRTQYHSANTSNIRGATHLRSTDSTEFERVLRHPTVQRTPMTPELKSALAKALQSDLPFAQYFAIRIIGLRKEPGWDATLMTELKRSVAEGNVLGAYWICETLGDLKVDSAVPELIALTRERAFPNTFGPVGMPYGLPASRAIGRILGNWDNPVVVRLRQSSNLWLQSGVLDGLADAESPNTRAALQRLRDSRELPPLIQQQVHYSLMRPKRSG